MRALLAIVLLPALAHAGNTEISMGSFTRSLRTDSANAISDENLAGPQFTVARNIGEDLDVTLPMRLQLWAVGGYEYGFVDGSMFTTITTQATTHIMTLGARARYEVLPWAAVGLRIDTGLQRTSLRVEGQSAAARDHGWGTVGAAALSADIVAAKHLGLRFEYGYLTASGVELSPVADKSEDMLELSTARASIGHLDLGGRFVTFSLLAVF